MKRELDLIREILLAIEAYEPSSMIELQSISPKDFSGTELLNSHHIRLLIDEGLINAAGCPTMQRVYSVHGLTMKGHDFLDSIRDQTIWDATKKRINNIGGWTMDIVLAVAKEEIKKRLGGLL